MDGLGDPKANNEKLSSTNNIGLNRDNTGTIDELKSNDSFTNDDRNSFINDTANTRSNVSPSNDGNNIDTPSTVSYTHLDVYKRQLI